MTPWSKAPASIDDPPEAGGRSRVKSVKAIAFVLQCGDAHDSVRFILQWRQLYHFCFVSMRCHPVTLYLGLSFTSPQKQQ